MIPIASSDKNFFKSAAASLPSWGGASKAVVSGIQRCAKATLMATANTAACVAPYFGWGTTKPVVSENMFDGIDLDAVRNRAVTKVPSEKEIRIEVEKFGNYIARLIPMRMIDQFICPKGSLSEDYYLALAYRAPSDAELRKAYFDHLDRSNLFFLSRWVAKIAYCILFPIVKKTIHDTMLSVFDNLELYLNEIKNIEYNDLVNYQLNRSNVVLENWVVALHNVAKNPEEFKATESLLTRELSGTKYHADMDSNEFYDKVTKKALAKFYVNLSLGVLLFRKLVDISIPLTNSRLLNFVIHILNFVIRIVTIPIATIIRLLLFIPDVVFNHIFYRILETTLLHNRVIETILDKALQGIGTNKGLSIPVLTSLNEALEEVLVEIQDGENVDSVSIKEGISERNKEILHRNVELSLHSADLHSQKTVADLKKMIKPETPISQGWSHWLNPFQMVSDWKNKIREYFHERVTEGVVEATEEVTMLVYQKLTDPRFIRQKAYDIISGSNRSFSSPPKSPAQRNKEFLELEQRLFKLVKDILSTAVNRAVAAKTISFLTPGEAAANLAGNAVLEKTQVTVQRLINMISSQNFLKYQLDTYLVDFLKQS